MLNDLWWFTVAPLSALLASLITWRTGFDGVLVGAFAVGGFIGGPLVPVLLLVFLISAARSSH